MTQLRTKTRDMRSGSTRWEPRRRRFTVDEYERMITAGIIEAGEKVELIEGEIVEMAAMGSPHAACVRRCTKVSEQRAGDRVLVSVQNPVRLLPSSEPEPDVAWLRPRADFYQSHHPGPVDVLLIIEIAHSTLATDRRRKIPMYARAGIIELWIVDVERGVVEVYRDPHRGRYRSLTVHQRGDAISPLAFPDLSIAVTEIVGETESL